MMPWTSNRIANEQPLLERRTIVRAGGSDCEHLFATPRQKHRFAMCMSEQHASIADHRGIDALREIRPAEVRRLFANFESPFRYATLAT
jgi:hypothetical protein